MYYPTRLNSAINEWMRRRKSLGPHGDATDDDLAVGTYEIAQILVEAGGGEKQDGDGVGSESYSRSTYRKICRS